VNWFDDWRERRRLTSGRAGAQSQRFASERLDRFVRANLLGLTIAVGFVIALSAGIWFLLDSRPGMQGLVAGAVVGAGFAMLYHWCVIASGATAGTMGHAAEEWTDSELRRLSSKGWRHVNHLIIKAGSGDIDHVAVGPDGVIVVETKWRSHEEDVDELSDWMASALKQAQRNRQQVVQLLNWQRRDPLLVQALVVLWGPDVSHHSAEAVLAAGVNVTAGQNLRDDLAALGDERLSPDEVEEVYTKLKKRIAERDTWEQKNLPTVPPTVQQRAARWVRGSIAAWVGLYLSLLTLRLGWWSIAAIAVLAALGFAARRIDEIRTEASALLWGVAATVPIVLVAVLVSL
jgi:hypothetical protein